MNKHVFDDGLDDWFADPINNIATIESIRAREIVHDQRSPEWFEARKEMLTGSRIAACLGIDPRTTQTDLLLKSIGMAPPEQENEYSRAALEWGIKMEPIAIAAYEEQTGEKILPFSLIKHEHVPWIGGSPDGITEDAERPGHVKELYEWKCPWKRKIVYGEVPEYYLPQLYINMRCAKIHKAVFVEYVPDQPMNIVRINFSTEWWSENWPKIVRYWNRYLFYQATVYDHSLRVTEVAQQCRDYDEAHEFKHIRPKGKLPFLVRRHRREQGLLQEGEEDEVDTWPTVRKRKKTEADNEAERLKTMAHTEGEIVMYDDL